MFNKVTFGSLLLAASVSGLSLKALWGAEDEVIETFELPSEPTKACGPENDGEEIMHENYPWVCSGDDGWWNCPKFGYTCSDNGMPVIFCQESGLYTKSNDPFA